MAEKLGRIACVVGADSMQVQALFAAAVAEWRASGVRIAGVLAQSHSLPDRTCAAGSLRSIDSGRTFRIYLETAPLGTSCHLDTSGVQAAGLAIVDQVAMCDLVVLSKFGKLEVARSGLIGAFEAAIAVGKPLLTSVSDKHRGPWRAFAPTAIDLPADAAALRAWWLDQGLALGTTREA